MSNIPKLRFPEFTDAWEKCKLGEVAEIVRGASPRPIQDPKWFDPNSEIGWLRISDVTEQNGRIHFLEQKISKLGQEKTRVLLTPHLLLSIAATVGKPVINYVKTGVHDGFLIFLNPKFDQEFMFQWLEGFRDNWQKYGQPGSQVNLNSDLVKSQEIHLPTLPEQQKIGTLFRRLDRLITLHKRKWDDVILLKKALLQKMFPKNGADFPEIRFPEFTDAWEKCKLGEVAEIVRGASPRPIQDPKWFDPNSEIGWLRISDVTEQNGRIHFLEQKISKLGQEKTRVLLTPHLLLSIAATVGKPVINYVKTGVHDGFLIFLNPKFDQEFMFQWLEGFRDNWQKYGQPGSQVNLNSDLVKSQEIHLPTLPEQQKIGTLFRRLDRLITLHKRQHEHYQLLKKALLQQMFV
ncbi:restriction endonuclease subunit S [Avibacterium paragallinarum]|uniref:restriction endonuclease subunit S n=1 Tax=Avibacterium paragallinarum TaxID=728 RepID=UPI0021F7507C|nr:restriction endonuclease subunit S [Avibacterium paragallinarum]UXN36719.1 restriction endonuclease subunit S [Avibacterium paragallinarum]